MSLRFKTVAMMMGLGLASSAVAAERTSLAVGPVIIVRYAVRTDKAVGPKIIVERAVRTDKAVGPVWANAVPTDKAVGPVIIIDPNAVRTDKAVGPLSARPAREGATSRAGSAVLDLNQGF